jgi:hypothetical protein
VLVRVDVLDLGFQQKAINLSWYDGGRERELQVSVLHCSARGSRPRLLMHIDSPTYPLGFNWVRDLEIPLRHVAGETSRNAPHRPAWYF